MAYYIVFFGAFDTVIDIQRYSEEDIEEYHVAVRNALKDKKQIQYGYF